MSDAPRVCAVCSFDTPRLSVTEWHAVRGGEQPEHDLAQIVASIMTEPVTRTLPTAWQGDYTADRAEAWIAERDGEGTTLLAVDRSSGQAIGLVILFEFDAEGGAARGEIVDVRLGYMLTERAWGKGLASELVQVVERLEVVRRLDRHGDALGHGSIPLADPEWTTRVLMLYICPSRPRTTRSAREPVTHRVLHASATSGRERYVISTTI